MTEKHQRVCPVEMAGHLDNKIRRWLQNPRKILRPHIQKGMTVLDVGCGPGFFSFDMARLVGDAGRVIAVDLQEGMLEKIGSKIRGTAFEKRITLHRCTEGRIGVVEVVDFVLLFYVFHEVPNQDALLAEIGSLLKPDGRLLIVEPPLHVSKSAFEAMIGKARNAGFRLVARPKVLFSKTALLQSEATIPTADPGPSGTPSPTH